MAVSWPYSDDVETRAAQFSPNGKPDTTPTLPLQMLKAEPSDVARQSRKDNQRPFFLALVGIVTACSAATARSTTSDRVIAVRPPGSAW
jgi:hypothetical protein